MYFLTNKRVIDTGNGQLVFEPSNELSQSIRYCKILDERHFEEIGSQAFMQALMQAPAEKEILFYIHGFNNQPYGDVLPRAQGIYAQLGMESMEHIEVIPIIWPCDNDFGVIKDYWDDQDAAESSGQYLSRVISKLMAWQQQNSENPCMRRMHLLAHSMGGRVLMKCLSHWSQKQGGGGVPYLFKNIFLMASDIPNESLEPGEEGHLITQAAQRVVCYYANDDFAMPASKVVNVRNGVFSRRIGHTGPEDMAKVPPNVYAVCCDSFNNKFDEPKGHTYFFDLAEHKSPAFQHLVQVLKTKGQKLGERQIEL